MNDIARNMLQTIEKDASLSPGEREALRRLRKGDITAPLPADRILRRHEAAARCARGLRTIDRWAKLGLLPRVRLPGFSRATGYRESDIAKLIAGTVAAAMQEGEG